MDSASKFEKFKEWSKEHKVIRKESDQKSPVKNDKSKALENKAKVTA